MSIALYACGKKLLRLCRVALLCRKGDFADHGFHRGLYRLAARLVRLAAWRKALMAEEVMGMGGSLGRVRGVQGKL